MFSTLSASVVKYMYTAQRDLQVALCILVTFLATMWHAKRQLQEYNQSSNADSKKGCMSLFLELSALMGASQPAEMIEPHMLRAARHGPISSWIHSRLAR